GRPLSKDIVITIEGDTPKTPFKASPTGDWGDTPPANSNCIFIYGNGALRTGWFGAIDRNQNVTGFDPATGAAAPPKPDVQAKAAATAVIYALARGDLRRVQDFSRTDITGLIV